MRDNLGHDVLSRLLWGGRSLVWMSLTAALLSVAFQREAGMPVIELSHDASTYFDVHHTANDTLSQVDPQALRQSVAAFGVTAWLGAQYAGDWERVTEPKPPRR